MSVTFSTVDPVSFGSDARIGQFVSHVDKPRRYTPCAIQPGLA
jgi:hypothetical protein